MACTNIVICFENLPDASGELVRSYVVSGRCYQSDFSAKFTLCSVKLSKTGSFPAFEQAFLDDK